jgi:outer membrane protein OmpA-like peptidoglycan-associated protein
MAGGTGKEVNFWPGFVDALANVVVVMIFVVVVFTIALLYFAQNKIKEAASIAQAGQKVALAPAEHTAAVAALQQRIAELQRENDKLRSQAQTPARASPPPQAGSLERGEIQVVETKLPPGPAPALAQIQGTKASLQVFFPAGAIELDPPSIARLEAAFSEFADKARAGGIELVGIAEVGSYSEGRRLSYYRNLALRNWLIEKGIPSSQIRLRLADANTGGPQGIVQLSTAPGR